ncbi:hypothetical protein GF339_18205 [candidate division KSB3 bacterium]|uniref:Uncharacterized protein n=1 Tax=candidate division KSB3 bacterium TaxID=2044937 RepID=A0A9D5JYL8_9BACT|nr:hypothetical protein [candidate division KSB3 bacterium]MBD3326523.1 hypothetical protein [candidate division KSB3 bacterium]
MADRFGLETSWQKLRQRWEQTKSVWHDPVSRDFEKNLILPLADQQDRTVRELERLTEVIEQARRNVR